MQHRFEGLVENRKGLMWGTHTSLVDQVGQDGKYVAERMNLKGDMRTNLVGQIEQFAGDSVRRAKMEEEESGLVQSIRTAEQALIRSKRTGVPKNMALLDL